MERRRLIKLAGTLGVVALAPAAASAAGGQGFFALADEALDAMKKKAEQLQISGCAVVAFCEGETLSSWSSKMLVVGRYRDEPKAQDKGSNLLAIAYAKAAEMADTHRDSGSKVREPMTGELGWEGGVTAKGRSGYLIAAFSGGKSAEDVEVSRAGLERMESKL